MNKVRFLPKIIFTVSFLFSAILAQPSMSINGSVAYDRLILDAYEDLPFGGIAFNIGINGLIPLTDIAKFGVGASIGYASVSSTDDYDVELATSQMGLLLMPELRFGPEEKIYASVVFEMSIPLSSKATLKIPGRGTQSLDVDDPETGFAAVLLGRYNFISVGIGKYLTGNNAPTILGAGVFIPISEQFEITPTIKYFAGKNANELQAGVGFEYSF